MAGPPRLWLSLALAGVLFLAPHVAGAQPTPAQRPAAPSPSKLQLAQAVLEAAGSQARVSAQDGAMEMERYLTSALYAALPNAPPQWRPVMAAAVQEAMDEWARQSSQISAQIYASRFTVPELTDMLNFYRSPGGRALLAHTPDIAREKRYLDRKLSSEIVAHLVAVTCAKVDCGAPASAPPAP